MTPLAYGVGSTFFHGLCHWCAEWNIRRCEFATSFEDMLRTRTRTRIQGADASSLQVSKQDAYLSAMREIREKCYGRKARIHPLFAIRAVNADHIDGNELTTLIWKSWNMLSFFWDSRLYCIRSLDLSNESTWKSRSLVGSSNTETCMAVAIGSCTELLTFHIAWRTSRARQRKHELAKVSFFELKYGTPQPRKRMFHENVQPSWLLFHSLTRVPQ